MMTANPCATYKSRVDRSLSLHLPQRHPLYTPLIDGMEYALHNGGKRIRPALLYATGQLFNVPLHILDLPACAIEYIHSSSLVHDDLPAMDDSDLRRGKPTCHKIFGDDMAILVGDALLMLAHEIIADKTQGALSDGTRLTLLGLLSHASGPAGMVAGQAIDIRATGCNPTLDQLVCLHRLKTGAVIKASILMGMACSTNVSAQEHEHLTEFAELIGLCFQVQDDIIDVTSDDAMLGKPQGKDSALGKVTFPALLGLDEAKTYAKTLTQKAKAALDQFGEKANNLKSITDFLLSRTY
jgi:farnesyl diphosphate synthase